MLEELATIFGSGENMLEDSVAIAPHPEDPQTKAKKLVLRHIDSRGLSVIDTKYEIHVVWFCKTLQNWKALLTTTLSNGVYYEVTYNGDKKETYLDVYRKFENVCVTDESILW